MLNYFLDTETVGFHGVPVLLQYAINKGPVRVVHLWKTPIETILQLIADFVDHRVIAHNLRFDWFHISKLYNMLRLAPDHKLTPSDYSVNQLAEWEYEARHGLCLKPRAAICTMLQSQKGDFQSAIMDAKPVWVRKVPVGLAQELCDELEARTDLPWILFARRKSGVDQPKWRISDRKDDTTGEVEAAWKDLKMSFYPSNGLKDLHKFLKNTGGSDKYEDIAIDPKFYPAECGWAPYALLLSNAERGWLYDDGSGPKPTWPGVIHEHVKHWEDERALAYAVGDIDKLRDLYELAGSPESDNDGMLACQVSSVRLRGFSINLEGVKTECAKSMAIVAKARLNVNSPKQVKGFVAEALDPMEQIICTKSCDQKVIDKIKLEFTLDEEEDCYCENGKAEDGSECCRCEGRGKVGPTGAPCEDCNGTKEIDGEKCAECGGTGLAGREMPVVRRVEHIEEIRRHTKRIEMFDKLVLAKRLYPDFNVIGTKSGRMSGASGFNAQGIDSSGEVRVLFTLLDEGEVLSGGDYSSQELAIAATTMNDDDLMKDLESGKSLHGLFGAELFQTTYEDIMANKNEPNSRYGRAKSAVYLMLYGGTFETMAKNSGVEVGICEKAYNAFVAKYPQMGSTRKAITDRFSSMKQDEEGRIVYKDPPEKFIESIFGFRRHFDTEYLIQRMLLQVIKEMPQSWKDLKIKLQRDNKDKSRAQTMAGCICSALYGACYSIQNKIIRASNNHVIQSTGREITMGLQLAIWDVQPQGIHEFRVAVMSIHDELAAVSQPQYVQVISDNVKAKVESQCETVPLIALEWGRNLKNWFHLKKAKAGKDDMLSCGWQETPVVPAIAA